jgi:hypothetical protein
VNYLGWLANVFLIIGLFLIGRKWRHAFALTVVGEVLWCVVSWQLGRADMLSLCVIFACLAGWNWWSWQEAQPILQARLKCYAGTNGGVGNYYLTIAEGGRFNMEVWYADGLHTGKTYRVTFEELKK